MLSLYRIAKPLYFIFTIFMMVGMTAMYGQACQGNFQATTTPTALDVQFINLSSGNYTTTSWDFGDGQTISNNASSLIHTYLSAGTYFVCVTVSDSISNCSSTYCNSIFVDASTVIDSVCYNTDCVFPGDANSDYIVNAYDVLPIALNYGTTGANRQGASTDFYGQYAPNWQGTLPDSTNLKHTDCNGDGIINLQDLSAIQQHFSFEHDGFLAKDAEGVPLYVVFDPVVYPTNPADPTTVAANIYLGNATESVKNINALAFLLDYDETIIEPNSVVVDFDNQSIFGQNNMPLEMAIDDASNGLLAIAYARTDRHNGNGFSKLATVHFTISDIVIGLQSTIQLNVTPQNIQGIDSLGVPVTIKGVEGNILFNTTSTHQQSNDPSRVRVYPNPAGSYINFDFDNFKGEQITIYNSYGQKVREEQVATGIRRKTLNVGQLPTGLYTITIRTEEGVISRQIFIN